MDRTKIKSYKDIFYKQPEKLNSFCKNQVIPLGLNTGIGNITNDQIVTVPYDYWGTLAVVSRAGSGKSILLKRIYDYILYWYPMVNNQLRPGVIVDMQSEDHWKARLPNTRSSPLYHQQGEFPHGIKNIRNYSPLFAKHESHNFDRLFGFSMLHFKKEDYKSLNITPTSIRSLFNIIQENKKLCKNPDEFSENLDLYPSTFRELQAVKGYNNFKMNVKIPMHPSSKNALVSLFDELQTAKIFVSTKSRLYKKSFIKDIKKGKVIVLNFHQMKEWAPLYCSVIFRELYEKRAASYRLEERMKNGYRPTAKEKKNYIKPFAIIVEEADLLLDPTDKNLMKGCNKYLIEYLRRGRKYGIFTMIASQEISSVHEQVKQHIQHYIVADLVDNDQKYFRNIVNPEIMFYIREIDHKKSSWGARKWIYIKNSHEFQIFIPFNCMVRGA